MRNIVSRIMRAVVVLFSGFITVFVMAGCSSGKIVKTYEGQDPSQGQIAVLTAPENIRVISVDGKKVPVYLLSGVSTDYALLPGEHVVTFEYEQVWAIPTREEGGERSREVVSDAKEVAFQAQAGQRLNFRFDRPGNLSEAEKMASTFSAELIDNSGLVLVTSTPSGAYHDESKAVASDLPSERPESAGDGMTPSVELHDVSLERLKALWSKANETDKKAFLKWVFE